MAVMTMLETAVCGGVDTHLEVHVAAAVDLIGGLLGLEEFEVSRAGYDKLLSWLSSFGNVARVGVEGTGSYGADLARFLAQAGVEVVEVDRPDRQERHRKGKSDPVDAIAAAHAALSGKASGKPKGRNGNVEAMRVLNVARRSARNHRIATLCQIRHVAFCAPDELRVQFKGLTTHQLVAKAAGLRPGRASDTVLAMTKRALRELGGRVQNLNAEIARLEEELEVLVKRTAPDLLALYGVGVHAASLLLIAAGDTPGRIRNEAAFAHLCGVAPIEASSGKVVRHRLNRGGDRQANNALFRIAMVRARYDPRTQAYIARREAEGRTKGEILRCLKRYIAREVFKYLPRDLRA
jgi:transposase